MPTETVDAIARAEAEAPPELHAASWTLTWLEGRPVVELEGGPRIGGDAHSSDDDPFDDDDEDLFPER